MSAWRSNGRCLLRDDLLVGMLDTPELATVVSGVLVASTRVDARADHYRRVYREETSAARLLESELSELRRLPAVARYVEARLELDAARLRRDQALRDLGGHALGRGPVTSSRPPP